MSAYGAGESIRNRQSSLPIFRGFGTIHVFDKRLSVAPGKRESRNFGQRTRLFQRDVLGARYGGPAGSSGIAGNDVIVGNCAALDVTLRAPGAIGKNFAAGETVFGGIGIDQQSGGAFPLGGKRFKDAIAVRIRIANENDFAV